MVKSLLSHSQQIRVLNAICTISITLSSSSPIISKMKAMGSSYHSQTVGKKGHTCGLPCWWLWVGMIMAITELFTISEADGKGGKATKANFSAELGANADDVTSMTHIIAHAAAIDDYACLKGQVLHCARRALKGDPAVQKDESESKDIVNIALAHGLHLIQKSVCHILEKFCNAQILVGPAPPSNMERELQRLVNRLEKK